MIITAITEKAIMTRVRGINQGKLTPKELAVGKRIMPKAMLNIKPRISRTAISSRSIAILEPL